MAKGLNDLEKQLYNFKQNLTGNVAKEIKKDFETVVENAIDIYYDEYVPKEYIRTGNFLNVIKSANVLKASPTAIQLFASSKFMTPYSTVDENGNDKTVAPGVIFNSSFLLGEHGHDSRIKVDIPPFERIGNSIQTGINGAIRRGIVSTLKRYL